MPLAAPVTSATLPVTGYVVLPAIAYVILSAGWVWESPDPTEEDNNGEEGPRCDELRLRVHRRERIRARRSEEAQGTERRLDADLRRGQPPEGHADRPRHRREGPGRGPRPRVNDGWRARRGQAGDDRGRRLDPGGDRKSVV